MWLSVGRGVFGSKAGPWGLGVGWDKGEQDMARRQQGGSRGREHTGLAGCCDEALGFHFEGRETATGFCVERGYNLIPM